MADKSSSSYIDDKLPTQNGVITSPSSGLRAIPGNPDHSHIFALPISIQDKRGIAGKIKTIFQVETHPVQRNMEMAEVEGDSKIEETLDLEDQRLKTESLKAVLSSIAQLWWADPDELAEVTEKLADGSRDPKWRLPLGDSGVLDFFLEIFSTHDLKPNLKIHAMRLIGNSCADTDENRARVVTSNYLPFIIAQLKDASFIPFAIPVLYNICLDYEPAQQQASASLLTKEIVDFISSPMFCEFTVFMGYICKVLDLMAAQPSDVELAPDHTARALLQIASNKETPVDMEDFIAITNTAVSYLKHERFQKALLVPGAMDQTLGILVDSYTRFDSHPSNGAPSTLDEEDAKALQQMRTNLNQVLSDVSALPEFKEACPVISPLASFLRRWLVSPQLQLQVCACIMLGNIARTDAACQEFVHTSRIHLPLISIIGETSDSSLLHAALGFLKNLALPAINKDVLGESGVFDALPRLWALDTLQQIQFASISLARQLTIGNFENVRKACKRLSNDTNSPAYSRTRLSLLIALFERTDVEPIKMEIARLITSVCRVYNSTGAGGCSPAELEKTRITFFERHPDVGRPLSFMVSQTKWPVVRSEGWFVFALMARSPEGAQCISDILHDVTVFRALVQMLTGKDPIESSPSSSSASPSSVPPSTLTTISSQSSTTSPDQAALLGLAPEAPGPHPQAAEMARIDRENALVLVSEMLKNRGSGMALMRRTLFEDLLKGGSEVVLSYREAKPVWEQVLVPKEQRLTVGLNLQEIAEQSFSELS